MITDEDDVLGTLKYWDESLWLRGLGCLIYEHLSESEVADSPITGSHTGSTYNIGILKDFLFSLPPKLLERLFIFLSQLSLHLLLFNKFVHL